MRDDLLGLQSLGALQVGLRHLGLARRLRMRRTRLADLDAVEAGQHLPHRHAITEIGVNLDDASWHTWGQPCETVLVRLNRGGHHQLVGNLLLLNGFDL